MLVDVTPNRVDQLLDASEHSAADPLVGNLAEPSFDQIQPGTARGDEVEVETLVPLQPGLDLGMFMGCVVVKERKSVSVLVSGRKIGVKKRTDTDFPV